MYWTYWLTACWTISTLIALRSRRWMDAGWCACFALFTLLDRMAPGTDGGPLKYAFLVLGVVLSGCQVARQYARYKKGEPTPRPKPR
jgi:uncharacterized membrane protein YhaH (DUF805 family)